MTEKKTLPPDDTPSVSPVPEAPPSPGPAAAEAKPDSTSPAVHAESAPASEPDPEETKHFKSKLKKKEGELRQLKKERDDLHDQRRRCSGRAGRRQLGRRGLRRESLRSDGCRRADW